MDEQIGLDASAERQLLVKLVFKPETLQGRPQPEEIQLILSCIGEILEEIEAEEKRLAAAQESENPPCR